MCSKYGYPLLCKSSPDCTSLLWKTYSSICFCGLEEIQRGLLLLRKKAKRENWVQHVLQKERRHPALPPELCSASQHQAASQKRPKRGYFLSLGVLRNFSVQINGNCFFVLCHFLWTFLMKIFMGMLSTRIAGKTCTPIVFLFQH